MFVVPIENYRLRGLNPERRARRGSRLIEEVEMLAEGDTDSERGSVPALSSESARSGRRARSPLWRLSLEGKGLLVDIYV